MRLRQPELGGDSGGRDRRARAVQEIGPGEAGNEGGRRGDHGQLHVGLHRGDVDVSVGVILGSGLGFFADTLENRVETPYSDIPGWPVSTAIGHAGKLVTGRLGGTDIVVAAGRGHPYEGYR